MSQQIPKFSYPNPNNSIAPNTLKLAQRNPNEMVNFYPPSQGMGQQFQAGQNLYASQSPNIPPGVPVINRGQPNIPPQMANINPNNGSNLMPSFPQVYNAQNSQPSFNPSNIPRQVPQFSGFQSGANRANNPIPNSQFNISNRDFNPSTNPAMQSPINYPQSGVQANNSMPPPPNIPMQNYPQSGVQFNNPNQNSPYMSMQNPQNGNQHNFGQPIPNPQNQDYIQQPVLRQANQYQPQMSILEKNEPCSPDKANLIRQYGLDMFIKNQYGLSEINFNGNQWILKATNNLQLDSAHKFLREKINEVRANIVWCWIADNGSPVNYSESQCKIIEGGYLKCSDVVIINNGTSYRIKFGNPHIQQMMNSNITRTVRRLDGVNRRDQVMQGDVPWFWQDDDGSFKPYTAEASRQIEQAYKLRSDNQLALVQGSNDKAYLMDFTNFKQLNEKTHFQRSIKRGSPN